MSYPDKIKTLKKHGGDSGQAIVEFALIVPILLTLLLGMMEWGFLLWTQTSFENATREGARAAVVMRDWGVSTSTKQADVKTIVTNSLSALPASLKTGVANEITIDLLPGIANISSIKVSIVNHAYKPLFGLSSFLTPSKLSASAEFRYEGNM